MVETTRRSRQADKTTALFFVLTWSNKSMGAPAPPMPTAAKECEAVPFLFISGVVPPLRPPEAVQLRENSFYDTVLKFCFLFHNGENFLPSIRTTAHMRTNRDSHSDFS